MDDRDDSLEPRGEPPWRERDPDAEIDALLDFTPVPRKCVRREGWNAERQRGFIAALAATGNQDLAAHEVGLTARGAYQLRKSAGAAEFADAWDGAIDLHRARNRLDLPQSPRAARADGRSSSRRPPAEEETDPREQREFWEGLLAKYRLKLQQERECRLAGRIVEADFYVRQLTFIEIGLDLGGRADALHDLFRSGDLDVFRTIGTPMSVLLDRIRRDYWREKGEADRMPLPLLGDHDEKGAAGHGSAHRYDPERDGDYKEWRARRRALEALQAEAQRLWEEKAKADAEAWAERVRRAEGGGPARANAGDARP